MIFPKFFSLFIAYVSLIDGFLSINICAPWQQERDLKRNGDIQKGIFIEVNPDKIDDGFEFSPPRSGLCDLRLPNSDPSAPTKNIELSFAKDSKKNKKDCMWVAHEPVNGTYGKLLNCTVNNTPRKILRFTGKRWIDVEAKFYERNGVNATQAKTGLRALLAVDTRLYIRSVPYTVVPATVLHVAQRVNIQCDYPNDFLLPSLFFEDLDNNMSNLTANMKDRNYSKDILGKDKFLESVAGKYYCNWWEESAYQGPDKIGSVKELSTSIFDVNVYAENIICKIGNEMGNNVEFRVLKNAPIKPLPISCMLGWLGSNQAVRLDWEHDVNVDFENGWQEKSARFIFSGIVEDSVSFTCRVSKSLSFDGGIVPNPCSVKLVAVDNLQCTDGVNGYTCQCTPGYRGENCDEDVNECDMNTHNCDLNADCSNSVGSFTCSCKDGYTGDGTTGNCADKDECTLKEDDCDENAACTDTPGSFTCACNTGYTGDGKSCTNKDECTLKEDDCDKNAACTDTPGSFTCTCNTGYTGDGKSCTNKDECTLKEDDCDKNAACTDTPGSYTCACNTGYTGDGKSCTKSCSSHPLVALASFLDLALTEGSYCSMRSKQEDYRGKKSVTQSGKPCMFWRLLTFERDYHATQENNYCRNTDQKHEHAGCYTEDDADKWEDCDIPDCLDLRSLENIARHQVVTASSVRSGLNPATIVNGNTVEPIFYSKTEDNPWIKIDLQASFKVQLIKVYVSSESSWNALSPLAVMLENRKGRMHLCGILKESKGSNLQDVHCAGTFSGRYVIIKSMTKTALNLVEVEVWAD